ncbi:Bax inhibitor-1/YccA family protein [bacterium]|nr:Bax inhibitor-1/YccA family protein [bacterium]
MSQETVIEGEPLTINGTIQKTFCLFLILLLGASYTWSLFAKGFLAEVMTYSMVAGFVALLTALIIIFGRVIFLIPVYALAEGVLLGSLSALAEAQYPGIVFNAVLGTFGALFSMLFLYRMKLITCTEKFKSVVFISTTTIFLIYILDLVGSFFGYKVPFLYDCGVVGIAASLIIIIVAALNLIIDFDFIEKGAQNLIPKKFEWFGAFGLLVTLVWLYIEILKLLSKLNSRR